MKVLNRKIQLYFLLILSFMFCCVNFYDFSFANPITLYDTDLDSSERLNLLNKYDDKEYEKEISKQKAKKEKVDDEDDSIGFFDKIKNLKNNALSKEALEKEAKLEEKEDAENLSKEYLSYEETKNDSVDTKLLSADKIDDSFDYQIINKNKPDFNISDYKPVAFEEYSDLDELGRAGKATALLGKETMPPEGTKRGSIGMIKPSGWVSKKYSFVDGKFVYNRCHLIGWQLSNENDNEKNLITGTRTLNIKGMLPLENKIANYINETGNHVLYRVTPIFEGNNLLASRVQVEALSYEDNGEGIMFNILLQNYEPGVTIDYATGDNYETVTETENNSVELEKISGDETKKEIL